MTADVVSSYRNKWSKAARSTSLAGARLAPERPVAENGSELLTPGANYADPYGAVPIGYTPTVWNFQNGDKFAGGFGPTQIIIPDYWSLRERSNQLFKTNLYARGLIRRLVTNEIGPGLSLEAAPDDNLLTLSEDELNAWTDDIESRYQVWGSQQNVCDWYRNKDLGKLQRVARMEALIGGDVLVVLRPSRRYGSVQVQLISGWKVRTPLGGDENVREGHYIRHGIEFDTQDRIVAYWIKPDDFEQESRRLPAYGERSGRRLAWLVYGTDKRFDDVRGEPILSLVLQSLKEIDRYRDSVQRKALINSLFALQVLKKEDKVGTLPTTGGAVRKEAVTVEDNSGNSRTLNFASQLPGMTVDELGVGQEIKPIGSDGTDLHFGPFEEALTQAVAWANEIPPEILRLAFSNNYSASQAAINEFRIYLNLIWADFGKQFCEPIYIEWLISEALNGRIAYSDRIIAAWRQSNNYVDFGAWIQSEWYGQIKPSTDMLKQVKASEGLVAGGYSNRSREARILTGTKFTRNVKKLARENPMLADANESLIQQPETLTPPSVEGDNPPSAEEIIEQVAEGEFEELEALYDQYVLKA